MNQRAAGAVPAEGLRHKFVTYLWLGNEERGFSWFAESPKGWRLGDQYRDQAIDIRPTQAGTVLRINLIKNDRPFVIEKEREIVTNRDFDMNTRTRTNSDRGRKSAGR